MGKFKLNPAKGLRTNTKEETLQLEQFICWIFSLLFLNPRGSQILPKKLPSDGVLSRRFSTIDSSSAVDTGLFEWGVVKGDASNAGRYVPW